MTGDAYYPDGYLVFKRTNLSATFFFGNHCTDGAVHRFAARYRFARELQNPTFHAYTASVAAAYGALCKFLFAFGALETFVRVLGTNMNLDDLVPRLQRYPTRTWDARLREYASHRALFRYIARHSRGGVRACCLSFISRRPYNFLILAQAVRNSFGHGHLTASGQSVDPDDMRGIASTLRSTLLTFMNDELSKVIDDALEDLSTPPD